MTPRYAYKCKACSDTFEISHSLNKKLKDCPECKKKNVLERVPSFPIRTKTLPLEEEKKVGQVVKGYIEDTKEEVKKEKQKMREEFKTK